MSLRKYNYKILVHILFLLHKSEDAGKIILSINILYNWDVDFCHSRTLDVFVCVELYHIEKEITNCYILLG